jgi:DNA-binding NarL/FixJ family response regulator
VEFLRQILSFSEMALRSESIKTPILIASSSPENQFALSVLQAGGKGYLLKESHKEDLLRQ